MTRLTFILPIYKVAAYLPRAFESLKNQTCPDWEAILVDDGSPDNSGEICDKAALEEPRFKVIHRPNGGIGEARNSGLDAASGEYIHFFDPDDVITEDFTEKVLAAAEKNNADFIFFGFCENYVDENGASTGKRIITPPLLGEYSGEPFKEHFDKLTTWYYAWAKVVRRSLIEKNHSRFTKKKLVEDGIFYAQVFEQNPKNISLIKDALYIYTMGRGGSAISSFHPERVDDNFYLSQTIEGVLRSWRLLESKPHLQTLYYCYVRDLQLSIKNISLSPMSIGERTRWLKKIMSDDKIRTAVSKTPLKSSQSRNDKIKLLLLKLKMYRAVIAVSGANNR